MKPASIANGVPTKPDVDKLLERFGVPDPGTEISYTDIVRVITCERGSFRFASVTNAWRKILDRNHNIILRAIPGKGFAAMTSADRVLYCGSKYKSGLRHVARSASVAERTNRTGLTENQTRSLDHLSRVGAAIRLSAAMEDRFLRGA